MCLPPLLLKNAFRDEKTIWELFCYSHTWREVTFRFPYDPQIHSAYGSEVSIKGDFNGWKKDFMTELPPQETDEQESGSAKEIVMFESKIKLPEELRSKFQFFVGDTHVLSHEYVVYEDVYHEVHVPVLKTSEKCFSNQTTELTPEKVDGDISKNDAEGENVDSPKIRLFSPGSEMELSKSLTNEMFLEDSKHIQFADVVRNPVQRKVVLLIVRARYTQLLALFHYYGLKGISNELQFITLCKNANFWLHRSIFTRIFKIARSVTQKVDYDEDYLDVDCVRYDEIVLKLDTKPIGKLYFVHFVECMIRLALIVYSNTPPDQALDKLCQVYLKRLTEPQNLGDKSIRSVMMSASMQKIFEKYSTKLLGTLSDYFRKIGAEHAVFITPKSFLQLLQDKQLIDGSLSLPKVRKCIADTLQQRNSDHLVNLYYTEFLEAISRIADVKFSDDSTLSAKLEKLIKLLLKTDK